MLGSDKGVASIAKATKLSRQTVYRIKDNPADCEASLAA
jgi:DNA-binding phage protein